MKKKRDIQTRKGNVRKTKGGGCTKDTENENEKAGKTIENEKQQGKRKES